MRSLVFANDYLLLDMTSVINLYASRRMAEILLTLPVKVGVVDVVWADEMLYVWAGPDHDVRQAKAPIDLQPMINHNTLIEIAFTDEDCATVVELAGLGLENGECITGAVALRRH